MACAFPVLTLLLLFLAGGGVVRAQSEPTLPEIELRAVAESEGVHSQRPVILWLFVSNKSTVTIEELSLESPSEAFDVELPPLPEAVPAFGASWFAVPIVPKEGTAFGKHQVPFVLRYRWANAAVRASSAQTVSVTIDVRRWFDEESKGLPGGTAALFTLLFPVIPAFLAFQFVDRLRRKEGLRVPTFGTEFVAPAFLIAILINSWALIGDRELIEIRENPFKIVVLSLFLGALWPSLRWSWDLLMEKLWAFSYDERVGLSYVRKALLSPWVPRPLTWITGSLGEDGEDVAGLLLRQPDGSLALGSLVQVNSRDPDEARGEQAKTALELEDQNGSLWNRCHFFKRLRARVKDGKEGKMGLSPQECVVWGGASVTILTGEEIQNIKVKKREKRGLLVYSQ